VSLKEEADWEKMKKLIEHWFNTTGAETFNIHIKINFLTKDLPAAASHEISNPIRKSSIRRRHEDLEEDTRQHKRVSSYRDLK
jgi:hypothetical protein